MLKTRYIVNSIILADLGGYILVVQRKNMGQHNMFWFSYIISGTKLYLFSYFQILYVFKY